MKKVGIKKIYIFINVILIFLIILSIIYILDFFLLKKEAAEESNLLNTIEIDENEINLRDTKTIGKSSERIIKIRKLQKENPDIIGWLEIENTNINYPVLQGTDNEYYMTHNYKKEKSKKGSIFLSKDYDWSIPSTNLLIYGHNLRNGTMFEELLKYENEEFYKEHPSIRFTTAKEDAEYAIIAVFKSRVYYQSESNVFRYYYFVNAKTQEEYNKFVENAKQASLYNIEETASNGEQLITLSTCSYHTEDVRFVVVERKI